MKNDDPRPTVWPPPPALPELEAQTPLEQSFENQRLGALSPLCVTLGFVFGLLAPVFQQVHECAGPCGPNRTNPPNYFTDVLFVLSGSLVLAGLFFGLFNWRTFGGKIGILIVVFPLTLILILFYIH